LKRLSVNNAVHTSAEVTTTIFSFIFFARMASLSACHLAHVVRDFASRGP
jgi:hypothetical protein